MTARAFAGQYKGGSPMQVHMPRDKRPVATVFAGVVFGALLAGAGPEVSASWDRPACAETVMRAVSTDQTVHGTYACFDESMRNGLLTLGIDSDSAFATRVGQSGDYRFVQKTADGGYVYEYDRQTHKHDKLQGAIQALGLPRTSRDVQHGNINAAWNERHDLGAAWSELMGQTQGAKSELFTFYMDGRGKVTSVK
jgi:hypothetical protein